MASQERQPPIDIEVEFWEGHKEELQRKHAGQFLLIKGRRVQAAFRTFQEAFETGARMFPDRYLVAHAHPLKPRSLYCGEAS